MKNEEKKRIRINGTEQTAAQPNGYRSFKKHTTFAPLIFHMRDTKKWTLSAFKSDIIFNRLHIL